MVRHSSFEVNLILNLAPTHSYLKLNLTLTLNLNLKPREIWMHYFHYINLTHFSYLIGQVYSRAVSNPSALGLSDVHSHYTATYWRARSSSHIQSLEGHFIAFVILQAEPGQRLFGTCAGKCSLC